MRVEDIEAQILQLAPKVRAMLAEKLLKSLDALSEEENAALWADEALRRDEEFEAGGIAARSGTEVFRDARARLT